MRRIYDSEAIERDDDEPFKPRERDREHEPQSFRYVNASVWSDRLVPHILRRRAVSVSVSTPAEEFECDSEIPFVVKMRNSLPVPLTLKTRSPLVWTWSVDGLREASRVPLQDPPQEVSRFKFDRGETRTFRKSWSGMFRVSEREWEPASPGEYTISVAINTDNAEAAGLTDETTIRLS